MIKMNWLKCILTILAIAVFSGSVYAGPEQSWSLIGTWINPTYETTDGYSAKLVYNLNGTWSVYKTMSDTAPSFTGTYTIAKDWTEAGIHWFQVTGTFTGGSVFYELDKITNDGSIYESTAATTGYPTAIDRNAGFMTTLRFRMGAHP